MSFQAGTQWTCGPDEAGLRFDMFIIARAADTSRSRVQKWIEQGCFLVNGEAAKKNHTMAEGDEVAVAFMPEPDMSSTLVPEDIPFPIAYEDEHILVVDKPKGMVTHPGNGIHSGTLANALAFKFKSLSDVNGPLRPGILHRLDKDTSGLLVVAKHDQSLRALQAAFKSREVEKTYLALVLGQPPAQGTFRTLHGRHPVHRTRFTGKVTTGKPAVTHFKVLERFPAAALVEVGLETGRTHQIRVHFAEAGFPLISDSLYGGKKAQRPELIGRQALHAWKLSFEHPRTGKALTFTAAPPKDFKAAEKRLRQA